MKPTSGPDSLVLGAGGYEFRATVRATLDYRNGRVSAYGATETGEDCVNITITPQHEDQRLQAALPAEVASLNGVKYAPCCAQGEHELRRGGGMVMMVKAAC